MLGRERERTQRIVAMVTKSAVGEMRAAHPDALFIHVRSEMPLAWWSPLQDGILLLDPVWQSGIAVAETARHQKLNQDLARLLRAHPVSALVCR